MKHIIIVIILAVFTLGCSKKNKIQKPDNLITKDKMVNVLIDLSLMSSAKGINKKIIENNGIVPDEFVYKKHQIDSTQFAASNAYYAFKIDDYKEILQQVEDSLERLKKKYNKLIEVKKEVKTQAKKESKTSLEKDSILKPKRGLIIKDSLATFN